ncbi:uncharacterized protein LTR77_001981 [Saxophila tyrrhenica]|uniref:F-box domain-containing protein n=1 Tax=Saxophila tyrrhenica TaxID=1690608 RepID=A0AAV9PHW5_9PEZI|nr:hypothetical protein LTR77_001981 [Saxophila tyrrhenica]
MDFVREQTNRAPLALLDLPVDILTLLPKYLANIEDYLNVSSTCRHLRECMSKASPNTILHLAAAQRNVFFRPAPHLLVCATAAQLGQWARKSDKNEAALQEALLEGIYGMLDLSLKHCGLTMQRIRELHLMRFSIVNPVTDIIDKCVGVQWYSIPDFWYGGASDAYTISADPSVSLFHLAIYGELFAPDFDSILNKDTTARRLGVDTRLEYIKYCVPDWHTDVIDYGEYESYDAAIAAGCDPRRANKPTGPYRRTDGECPDLKHDHNYALSTTLESSRWRPHWKAARQQAGGEFDGAFFFLKDRWNSHEAWRQRMWEAVCICQGLEGLGMMRPQLRPQWIEKMKEWRERIAALEKEPAEVTVGEEKTREYPFLIGDLLVCVD